MDITMKKIALAKIAECVQSRENFVLQGGAGSGKTETLKQVLEYVSSTHPKLKVVCITHTNLAVDEIVSRVGADYLISTIHSFLNTLIKDYKKNIHQVIYEIFKLENIVRKDISEYKDGKEQKTAEHNNFKKLYEKYANKLYSIKSESIEKVIGKREYDKDPEKNNSELNSKIDTLNIEIKAIINDSDYNKVGYNETRFDSLNELTFGHDNLINITYLLFKEFPLLSKIIQDKFDLILIDEYQDTNKSVIEILLDIIPSNSKTIIGLFGDSMQGIYEDGIGNVESYISDYKLKKIEKEDNYRCSVEVIDFINKFRNDGLKQKVAFKKNESIEDRKGEVKLYYDIYNSKKPHSRSSEEEKSNYLNTLKLLITKVEEKNRGYKKLMLTNKSISDEVGFKNLYDVFNDRYFDVKDEIEKCLGRLQLIDLAELCYAYEYKNYNFILTEIKNAGFKLINLSDKKKVAESLDSITTSSKNIFEIMDFAFENNFLKKSDSYISYIKRKDSFIEELKKDELYIEYKKLYENGLNTFTKMFAEKSDLENEKFNEYEKLYKREKFYIDLFSDKISFNEIYKYFIYLNEGTNYITMHKTKGSGIENVLVVLEEYFWNKYDFKIIFDSTDPDEKKRLYNQKLFYVACSRAISNLICIKLIESDEEERLIESFPNSEKINCSL